jgi:molybdopterin synthase sulfur carrier subunit
MKISILAFGIARDVFKADQVELDVPDNGATVEGLRKRIEAAFPGMTKLASYMVAINSEYASGGDRIREKDEIAIIPPVSGG